MNMNSTPTKLRDLAAAQPNASQALARLEGQIAVVQTSQRRALGTLIELSKTRPEDAERFADEVVECWTRAAMGMLSAYALGTAEPAGHA